LIEYQTVQEVEQVPVSLLSASSSSLSALGSSPATSTQEKDGKIFKMKTFTKGDYS
jgi:hypothetical protein